MSIKIVPICRPFRHFSQFCLHLSFFFVFSDVLARRTYGTNFWTNFWDKFLGQTFGTYFWDEFLGRILGTNFRDECLGRIFETNFGTNFWDEFQGRIFGTNICNITVRSLITYLNSIVYLGTSDCLTIASFRIGVPSILFFY